MKSIPVKVVKHSTARIVFFVLILILLIVVPLVIMNSKSKTIIIDCSRIEEALNFQAKELIESIAETTNEARKNQECRKQLEECNEALSSLSGTPIIAGSPLLSSPQKLTSDHSCIDCGYWQNQAEIKINSICYNAYIYQTNATLQTLPILKLEWLKQGNDYLIGHCKLCGEEIWCAK